MEEDLLPAGVEGGRSVHSITGHFPCAAGRFWRCAAMADHDRAPSARARPILAVREIHMRDVILLEGIQVPAALGVTAAERRMRRPVLLDLEVVRDLRDAGRSDSIRHTIHYKRVFEIVQDVAGNQEHKLVEALGDRIARAVLSKFDAEQVVVTVRKPTPIAGVLQYAGVRIARTREDVAG
jgi:dihydroneopterin aldolase